MKDLRSPLAKAKGLGASGDNATHHFWVQRITALALVPMVIWLCFSIALLPDISHNTLVTWLRSPFNAILSSLLVIIAFQHAHLGMQVIIEDYISDHGKRMIGILVVKFLSYMLMATGLFAIIKISLGGQ